MKPFPVSLLAACAALACAATPQGVQDFEKRQAFSLLDDLEAKGAYVLGDEGVFLGKISKGRGSDSLGNEYGAGSSYKQDGLFNKFSKYGSSVAATSAFNSFASDPPQIMVKSGGDLKSIGLLTTNKFANTSGKRISPYVLQAWLKAN
ncbi:MAG: hypothetical protein ACAH95_06985 [Fimbriimonas sp.]